MGAGYLLDSGWKVMLAMRDVRPEDVLRLAGLPDDLFNQASIRLPPEAHDRLVQTVDDVVGDPLLPLWMAEQLDASTFSPPIFVGLCSPDLRVASQRIALFKPLVGPLVLDVVDEGDLTLTIRFRDGVISAAPLFVRFEMLFFTKLARLATRARIEPAVVRTPDVPESREAFEAYLGCPIEKGPHVQVTFREIDARRPFLTSNPTMWAVFEPELRKRLAELEGTESFTERTRAVLLESLPAGITDVGNVAGRLALSGRTLQRRLRDEGTSFKAVVRELREELAHHYLNRTQLTASEIAYLVGFDQPSSFFRAFHEWTGRTPEAVRAANG
ncbi:MAG: AraC family transcriptional regulator ligand-binding domain-containing protein [Myxococcota bacterium]